MNFGIYPDTDCLENFPTNCLVILIDENQPTTNKKKDSYSTEVRIIYQEISAFH